MGSVSREDHVVRRKLVDAAKRQNVSMAQLSRLLGRNSAYLHQFVGRFSPRKLEEGDRHKLAEFLGIAETELRVPGEFDGASKRSPANENAVVDWVHVPRLPLDASAGPGVVGAEEIPYDHHQFSRRWLREMGLEGAELTAIRVEGDSMEPLLRSGDEIFVDRNKRAGEGVHVVRIGDALHVKQVQLAAPGRIKLVSANEAYPPVELDHVDVEIIGRVVWKGGRV